MSKLHHRKLSRVFPAYHPRRGEETYFVEKLIESLILNGNYEITDEQIQSCVGATIDLVWAKHHTIRAGNHVKAGDKIRFSVWSAKPYCSKQIVIAPDIEVMNVWDFEVKVASKSGGCIYLNNRLFAVIDTKDMFSDNYHWEGLKMMGENDGLTSIDFLNWFQFPKPFQGQLITWNPDINY